MPNQSINPIRATVTTHRSNNTAAFFDLPKDATPQDCKDIVERLISQSLVILWGICPDHLQQPADTQLLAAQDLLQMAEKVINQLDIGEAVAIAQRGED